MTKLVALALLLLSALPARAGVITAASTARLDVQAAINLAQVGDVVAIPAGSVTWGAGGAYLSVNKAVFLQGAGIGETIITLADDAGTYTNAVIRITAAAAVSGFSIIGSDAAAVSAFSASTANGWRISGIDYTGGTAGAYFVYASSYGLIDGNTFTGNSGRAELIFVRGPTDSWQTAHSIGGADNVFIENNTFDGSCYVSDCNSNARCVVRYNTINGPNKIDGHGKATNTPARGVRHMEIYNNTWTYNAGSSWAAIELRGGGGRIFDNTVASSNASLGFYRLTDYGMTSQASNFGGVCQCPSDYPIDDMIGVGVDPKSAASEPVYLWGNTKGGSAATLSWAQTTVCTSDCGGAFNMADVIVADRDYYISATKPEAMASYTPYTYPHPLSEVVPATGAATIGSGGTLGTGGSGTITLQ